MDLTWSRAEVSLFDESGVNLPCVGTIISSYLILTVASCLYGNGKGKNGLSIRTKSGRGQQSNSNSKWEERQIRNTSQILFHPDFENSTKENDVAILVLDEQLNLNLNLNLNANLDWRAKTMATRIINESTSTSMNFVGRLCREDSELSPLLTTKCPQFLPKSEKLCLLPVDSNSNSNEINVRIGKRKCLATLPGSSLICSDEKGRQFLCGILSSSLQNPDVESAKIYTSIAPHLKWIQSASEKHRNSRNSQSEEHSVGCGGFINLEEEREMVYKIPSKELQGGRGRNSICLWIVSTGRKDRGASIEVTILNNPSAQFNSTSDIIFADSNFETREDVNKTIDQIGVQFTIPGPFMALYYRSNSTAPNAGLHLKLRDSITQSAMMERLNVKLITLVNANMNMSEIQEFSYPSSDSGPEVSTYSNNERTFFILKPQEPGAKIRVNLTFVDTEPDYDWLEISTYRVESITLFRFNGRSNWTEKVLEGREDEPLFLYFHSDRSRQRRGFKIQYSEIAAPAPSPCGGLLRLEEEQELVYKVPEELRGGKVVCVWVVAATNSQIEYNVLTNPRASFQPQHSNLYMIRNFKRHISSFTNILPDDKPWIINQPFFVLYFRTNSSAPHSGFHIHFKPIGLKGAQKTVNYLEQTNGGTNFKEFKYPLPPATNYADNERTFIIVKPETLRGRLKLRFYCMDTERNHDWMEILTVGSHPNSLFRFSGYKSTLSCAAFSTTFRTGEDEPFIIYFHSDDSVTKSGFKIDYNEEKA